MSSGCKSEVSTAAGGGGGDITSQKYYTLAKENTKNTSDY